MANILIEPISTESKGGYKVEISGIDPTSDDCLIGRISTPKAGIIDGEWDLGGTIRNGTDDCNINLQLDELQSLVQLAKKLKGY